jgi:ArsR family transcriptional regulator
VAFEQAEVDALPLAARSQDAVFLSLVLHHVPDVGAVLREAFRVLKPGGRVVVADLLPHEEETMRARSGDLRLGLDPADLASRLDAAGFADVETRPAKDRLVLGRHRSLDLFLATGRRPEAARRNSKPQPQGSRT